MISLRKRVTLTTVRAFYTFILPSDKSILNSFTRIHMWINRTHIYIRVDWNEYTTYISNAISHPLGPLLLINNHME